MRMCQQISKTKSILRCLWCASWGRCWKDFGSKMGTKWTHIGTKLFKVEVQNDVKK